MSINMMSEDCFSSGRKRGAAIAGDRHDIASFLEQPDGECLVDSVVFRQQDAQPPRVLRADCDALPTALLARRGFWQPLGKRVSSSSFWRAGFYQIGGDAELTAARCVTLCANRGQHHDLGAGEFVLFGEFAPPA